MDANAVEQQAADAILDRGVRYAVGEGSITIRPLRYGTVLMISRKVCESGLTQQRMDELENDPFRMFAEYGELMLACVAMAELNGRDALTDEQIEAKAAFYRDRLTNFQIYELFVHVLTLSGVQAFTNTIRLLLTMKQKHLSPRIKGS
jgi:hypothetical protein